MTKTQPLTDPERRTVAGLRLAVQILAIVVTGIGIRASLRELTK